MRLLHPRHLSWVLLCGFVLGGSYADSTVSTSKPIKYKKSPEGKEDFSYLSEKTKHGSSEEELNSSVYSRKTGILSENGIKKSGESIESIGDASYKENEPTTSSELLSSTAKQSSESSTHGDVDNEESPYENTQEENEEKVEASGKKNREGKADEYTNTKDSTETPDERNSTTNIKTEYNEPKKNGSKRAKHLPHSKLEKEVNDPKKSSSESVVSYNEDFSKNTVPVVSYDRSTDPSVKSEKSEVEGSNKDVTAKGKAFRSQSTTPQSSTVIRQTIRNKNRSNPTRAKMPFDTDVLTYSNIYTQSKLTDDASNEPPVKETSNEGQFISSEYNSTSGMSIPTTTSAWALASLKSTSGKSSSRVSSPTVGPVKPYVQWSKVLTRTTTIDPSLISIQDSAKGLTLVEGTNNESTTNDSTTTENDKSSPQETVDSKSQSETASSEGSYSNTSTESNRQSSVQTQKDESVDNMITKTAEVNSSDPHILIENLTSLKPDKSLGMLGASTTEGAVENFTVSKNPASSTESKLLEKELASSSIGPSIYSGEITTEIEVPISSHNVEKDILMVTSPNEFPSSFDQSKNTILEKLSSSNTIESSPVSHVTSTSAPHHTLTSNDQPVKISIQGVTNFPLNTSESDYKTENTVPNTTPYGVGDNIINNSETLKPNITHFIDSTENTVGLNLISSQQITDPPQISSTTHPESSSSVSYGSSSISIATVESDSGERTPTLDMQNSTSTSNTTYKFSLSSLSFSPSSIDSHSTSTDSNDSTPSKISHTSNDMNQTSNDFTIDDNIVEGVSVSKKQNEITQAKKSVESWTDGLQENVTSSTSFPSSSTDSPTESTVWNNTTSLKNYTEIVVDTNSTTQTEDYTNLTSPSGGYSTDTSLSFDYVTGTSLPPTSSNVEPHYSTGYVNETSTSIDNKNYTFESSGYANYSTQMADYISQTSQSTVDIKSVNSYESPSTTNTIPLNRTFLSSTEYFSELTSSPNVSSNQEEEGDNQTSSSTDLESSHYTSTNTPLINTSSVSNLENSLVSTQLDTVTESPKTSTEHSISEEGKTTDRTEPPETLKEKFKTGESMETVSGAVPTYPSTVFETTSESEVIPLLKSNVTTLSSNDKKSTTIMYKETDEGETYEDSLLNSTDPGLKDLNLDSNEADENIEEKLSTEKPIYQLMNYTNAHYNLSSITDKTSEGINLTSVDPKMINGTVTLDQEDDVATPFDHTDADIDDTQYDTLVTPYLQMSVDATQAELCQGKEELEDAILRIFETEETRSLSHKQIVILNLGDHECGSHPLSEKRNVVPVKLYLTDSHGQYDSILTDKFVALYQQKGLNFRYPVIGVKKVVPDEMNVDVDSQGSSTMVAAIVISSIAGLCLLFLTVLLVVMRKRQKGFNYGQRCTPVSLEDYSLDNISVYNSVRRKAVRASKRSYGNPAFDDPGAVSNVLNFANLVNFSSDRARLDEEFSQIPAVVVKPDELPLGAEAKNRYANVIPLPETRVQLQQKQCAETLDQYINANYVKGAKGADKFYIACQAPLQDTVTDFWLMVWEQQSRMIIMLTDLHENGVEKCADYLPPSEVLDCHRVFGDLQVTLKKREVREKYIISSLQLKNLESNLWREVTHMWYVSWPHQGVPTEPSAIIAFLIEARSYIKSKELDSPIVVHCSPGTGRTGSVIAIDICIREFETNRTVDIPRTVYNIRRDRAGSVQTKDQYSYIYEVLHLYATKLTGGGLDSI